jgi:hypothetical protein
MYSYFNKFWTPAFAGVTLLGTFYEIIKFEMIKFQIPNKSQISMTELPKRVLEIGVWVLFGIWRLGFGIS